MTRVSGVSADEIRGSSARDSSAKSSLGEGPDAAGMASPHQAISEGTSVWRRPGVFRAASGHRMRGRWGRFEARAPLGWACQVHFAYWVWCHLIECAKWTSVEPPRSHPSPEIRCTGREELGDHRVTRIISFFRQRANLLSLVIYFYRRQQFQILSWRLQPPPTIGA